MFQNSFILILQILALSYGDWASEWMTPVQDEFGSVASDEFFISFMKAWGSLKVAKDLTARLNYDADLKMYEDQELKLPQQELPKPLRRSNEGSEATTESSNLVSSSTLQGKLEAALKRAQTLAATLREQIAIISDREATLKDVIANGRSGVSVVTVYTLARPPRSYLVRDGAWASCQGMLQPAEPYGSSIGPKCIGVETSSSPDPCVFNSVTKYETIPTRRRVQYAEDDFLCLKRSFNTTIEHYLSVPRNVVNDTCKEGVVRSLDDNVSECGLRVLSEYVYYPGAAARVPREYCETAPPGACRLLAAWHLSNTTIENFEFLKNEPTFKEYFIKNQ